MNQGEQKIVAEAVSLQEVARNCAGLFLYWTNFDDLGNLGPVHRVTAPAGAILVEPWDSARAYWVVLDGEIRADRPEPDGSRTPVGFARTGEGFGEAPLLTGKTHSPFLLQQ